MLFKVSRFSLLFMLLFALVLVACSSDEDKDDQDKTTDTPKLADTLVIYGWADGIPQDLLDAFTTEFGVKVDYQTFISYEEAVENIRAGQVYDVLWLGNYYVASLIQEGVLAEYNYANVPNAKNIAANFRDLNYDPGNRYSIPYTWGPVGLLYRSDLIDPPIAQWSDLWTADIEYVAIWEEMRTVLGLGLKSLGYSANSENPEELQAAYEHLLTLKDKWVYGENYDPYTSAYALADNRFQVAVAWAYDSIVAADLGDNMQYVVPTEGGAMLWGEDIVIPANNHSQYTAEVFINYLLRPEVSAAYGEFLANASTNDAAREFVDESFLSNPAVYPGNEILIGSEIVLPLSPEGEALYIELWQQFLDATKPSTQLIG